MPIEIQFIKITMYNGPTPKPCTIFKHVMDGMTMQGDEYIFKEHPDNMVPTGIMTLEGTTMTVLHGQKQLPDGRTGKWPKHTCNGKTFDSFNKPTNEVVGTAIFTYQASANEGVVTVIVTNEPEVVVKEEKEEKDEDAMSEQEDNKDKEEEEEAMSDEEDKKEKEDEDVKEEVNTLHPHMAIANRKAAASLALQEAKKKEDELKAAQDKADMIAFDEMSKGFKTVLAQIKEQKEDIKQTENEMFLNVYAMIDYAPLSVIPNPLNVTKPPTQETVRAWHVYKAKEDEAKNAAKIIRVSHMYAHMEGSDGKNSNPEKYFNMYLQNNPEESVKAQEALRAYKEDAKKPKKRVPEEAAGSSSRGSKAPRRAMGGVSRRISAGLKVKEIVKAIEKEGAKSNKKD